MHFSAKQSKLMKMRGWTKLLLIVIALAVLYWPGVVHHWKTAADPYFVPYDAVQYIPPFFKFETADPVPTTYIKEYYLNTVSPLLYKESLVFGSQLGDVRRFQLVLMYVAYAIFIGVLGRIGWLLGGAALSFAVVATTVTAWIFIGLGFTGGAPRMYGYPLIACVLYSLVRDRPYLLASTAVLGALLYPIIGLIAGACLASWLLLKPLSSVGVVSRWSVTRRLAVIGITGSLTLAGVAPLVLGSAGYGRRVVEADLMLYPEAGFDGNYRVYDQLPYQLFGPELATYLIGPLYSHGDALVPFVNVHKNLDTMSVLFALGLTGLLVVSVTFRGVASILKTDRGLGLRLISFFVICGILHVLAWLASPYLYIPTRYFMFSLPFVLTLILPWCVFVLLKQAAPLRVSPALHRTAFLFLVFAYLAVFGGRGNVEFVDATVEPRARPLFDSIARLPKDSLIAGWPVGQLRKVEYVTRRNAFLTGDVHQVLHLDFMQAMRQRMDALFEAYFSTEVAPLLRLRQEFGVTHLVVDMRDFRDPKQRPEYFSPWRARIAPRMAEIKGKEFLMDRSLHETAGVFAQNGLILLDLTRLPGRL